MLRIGCLISSAVLFVSLAAGQVGGSGTANHVPLWTSTTNLGSSSIVQSSGNIGIGNASPSAILDVAGKAGTTSNGGGAPAALSVLGGIGGIPQSGFGTQGSGGPIQFVGGTGGPLPGNLAAGGAGAIVLITGGTGAVCRAASVRCSGYFGGNGGSISLQPCSGGHGATGSGNPGKVTIAPTGGKVGVGTSTPSAGFEVGAGHSTLADSWTTRSSRRFKTNIHSLIGALAKIEQIQGVSYDRKLDRKHEIGVIAEDLDRVVPELVARNPESNQIEGVDYARLSALLIEAVKAQQLQIRELQSQVLQLRSGQASK